MRNIWTIAKREYNHYFISPIAYAIAFVILLLLGLFFAFNINYYAQNAFQLGGGTPDMSNIAGLFAFLMIFSLPALTMRLVSEETRMGTIELMLTAPVRDSELIIGKWLGSFLFVLTLIAATLVYPLIMNSLVDPGIDQRQLMSAYLGLILVAASLLSIGIGISAIFSNQIVAWLVTFGAGLVLWWAIGLPAQVATLSPEAGDVFRYLTMNSQLSSLLDGSIKLSTVIYFLSLLALGLFTGATAIEIRRWR